MSETSNPGPGNPITNVIGLLFRAVGVAVGLFLLVISIPLAVTPIPLGIPLFAISLLILAGTSKTAHKFITNQLKKYPAVWRRVRSFFGEKAYQEGEECHPDDEDCLKEKAAHEARRSSDD